MEQKYAFAQFLEQYRRKSESGLSLTEALNEKQSLK